MERSSPFTAAKYSIADQVLAQLPNKAKLGLYFNPYGKVLELIDDCISCGVDQLIDANGGPVWTEEGFAALHEKSVLN